MSYQVSCGKCNFSLVVRQRYITCIMVWFSLLLLFGSRYTIRYLIEIQKSLDSDASVNISVKDASQDKHKIVKPSLPDWSSSREWMSIMHYSYRVGYMLGHVPAGCFCDLYGSRHFLSCSLLASGVLKLLVPVVLGKMAWIKICFLVFINGILQGGCEPAAYSLLAHWVPNYQLTFLTASAYSGSVFGHVLCSIITHYFVFTLLYWRGVFYFWTTAIVVWYLVFIHSVFSSPDTHAFIKQEEKQQLLEEFGNLVPHRIPWRNILRDCALWAIVSAQIGHIIIQSAMNLSYRAFALRVYKEDVVIRPYLGLIPVFLLCCVIIPSSILGDYLIKKDIVPTTYLRSIYVGLGSILSTFFLILITFMRFHTGPSVFFFVCAMMCDALYLSAITATVIDRTRHYAGFYAAVTFFISTLSTPISEQLILKITKGNTMYDWKKAFCFTIAASIFTTVVYLVWNKGERAKWDVAETKEQIRRQALQK